MAISDNVRTIFINKNTLDPLADWSRSVANYSDRFGNRASPEILQYQALNERYEDGLRYRVQPQDAADFIEALEKTNPEIPGMSQQEIYEELFEGNIWGGNRNKFIYASTPIGPNGIVYKSFSEKILENVLDTASTILAVTKEDDDFGLKDRYYTIDLEGNINLEQFRESGASRFLARLRDSGAGRVEIREQFGATDLAQWFTAAAEEYEQGNTPLYSLVTSDDRTR